MIWLAALWKSFAGLDGLAKFLNGLLALWREQSAADVGARLERLKMREAEQKAQDDAEKIKPIDRDDLVKRLKSGGF